MVVSASSQRFPTAALLLAHSGVCDRHGDGDCVQCDRLRRAVVILLRQDEFTSSPEYLATAANAIMRSCQPPSNETLYYGVPLGTVPMTMQIMNYPNFDAKVADVRGKTVKEVADERKLDELKKC